MFRRAVLVLALILPALPALAGSKIWYTVGGVAIRGYDAVAYFKDGRAVQGSPEHSVKWAGALWYFASDDNRAAFEMDPRSFAPQYGGYCAYAMTEGRKEPSVPAAFSIDGGKLYLHRSDSEREEWKSDVSGNVALADAHWPNSGK